MQTATDQAIEQATQARRELVQKQNQAYNAAWARIRNKYRDEYDAVVDEEFANRGLDRRKRSTREQREQRLHDEKLTKAQERLDKLLAEHPELKEHLRTQGIG